MSTSLYDAYCYDLSRVLEPLSNFTDVRILAITKTCPCNIQRFSSVKIENFIRKMLIFFLIFAQNIDCGYTLEPPRRGGSNEYLQSMFWNKNKKNRYTPAYPSFAI